jgi:apolipoprotein N-acyltransferase
MTKKSGKKKDRSDADGKAAVQTRGEPLALRSQLFGATLTGILVFLSFPEFNQHALLWFSLVPLLIVLEGIRRRRKAFMIGWWAGFVTNIGGFYWIGGMLEDFGHLPSAVAWFLTILNAAYQGLVFALFAYLVVRLRTPRPSYRYLSIPLLMVFAETCFPFVFPWYFSNGIILATELTQIIELVGVEVATALIVLVNVALASAAQTAWRARRFPIRETLYALGLLGGLFIFGTWRINVINDAVERAPKLSIGMVEANVGIWDKRATHMDQRTREIMLRGNLMRHHLLSSQAVSEGAELIVWPETSYVPYFGIGIKRSSYFSLVRTQKNRLLIGLSKGRFLEPSEVEGAEILTKVDGHIRAVVGPREDTALILSRGGRIFRLGSHGWEEELSGVAVNLNAGWISGGNPRLDGNLHARSVHCGQEGPECDLPAVVVGAGGVYLRRRNSRWNQANNPSAVDLLAVVGSIHNDRTSIYAAGSDGTIVMENGSIRNEDIRLKVVHEGGPTLRAIAVSKRGRVAAVGDDCTVLVSTSKEQFQKLEVDGCTERLRAVNFLNDGRLVASGQGGTLLFEERARGELQYKSLGNDLYIREIKYDPFGRLTGITGSGKVLDLSDPQVEALPVLGAVGQPVYRMAHVGYLLDILVPDDAKYLYASPAPYPEGPNIDTRIRRDARSPTFDRDAVQRIFSTPLIFGGISYQADEVLEQGEPIRDNLQNTIFMLGDDGEVLGISHKMKLLIFGEYIPFGDIFPILYDWIPEAGRYIPGERVQPLIMQSEEHGPIRIAPLICYEDILPEFSAKVLALDPHLLVNITNDAWFGKTHEPALHLQLAAARSIETRRSLVRSTNTGISAFIDPLGKIHDPTSLEDAEIRVREVPLLSINTLYGFPARLLFWLCNLWVVILLLGELVKAAPRRARTRTVDKKTKASTKS